MKKYSVFNRPHENNEKFGNIMENNNNKNTEHPQSSWSKGIAAKGLYARLYSTTPEKYLRRSHNASIE